MYQHKEGKIRGFSQRYHLTKLVYYEEHEDVYHAIIREMRIKRWRRSWKLALIREENPRLEDLSRGWYDGEMPD